MGTLRFLLAMSVVYGHAGAFLGFPLIPGDTAVQCFYAISGFYMALILNEKYRPESSTYFLFISNRFARLFPAYATVLLLTLLLAVAVARFSSAKLPFVSEWRSLEHLDLLSAVFLLVTQIIMWGQDLFLFLALKGGALEFWPDFHTAAQPVYTLLAIPQGWTLGLEFSFYLVAPFIVRRSVWAIAIALAASLVLRLFFAVRARLLWRPVVIPVLPVRACRFPGGRAWLPGLPFDVRRV
jgi:peptidoglycan/LPS O-acetylase OafA/YrhL